MRIILGKFVVLQIFGISTLLGIIRKIAAPPKYVWKMFAELCLKFKKFLVDYYC